MQLSVQHWLFCMHPMVVWLLDRHVAGLGPDGGGGEEEQDKTTAASTNPAWSPQLTARC